jgi:hypothetical protein
VPKPAIQKASTKRGVDFANTFSALKEILTPYAAKDMRVVHDKPDYYCLETRFSVMGRGPLMFGAARKGKRYVSYHLVPLYMNQPLQNKVSPELKRRKQGKACFNFAKADQTLFAELDKLTRLGFDCFKKLAKDSSS